MCVLGRMCFKILCAVSANTSTQMLFVEATIDDSLLNFVIYGCLRARLYIRIHVTHERYVRFEILEILNVIEYLPKAVMQPYTVNAIW